jgi:hypothetical protein
MAKDTKRSDHELNNVLSNQMFGGLWKLQQISVRIVGVLAKIEAGTSRKQIVGITANSAIPRIYRGTPDFREIWIGVQSKNLENNKK